MKKIYIYLFFLTFSLNAFSITNSEINKICQKEVNKFLCIRRLKINRYKLEKGNPIEIPVVPYEK
tara:strand:+ start:506 stop:700 length:195 start_codon:yes stop_codon:yes gene_type:complete